jgi:hypothetical protein
MLRRVTFPFSVREVRLSLSIDGQGKEQAGCSQSEEVFVMGGRPNADVIKDVRKDLDKLEKKKAKNGGKAPAHVDAQIAKYRELIRRLS